MKIPLTIINNKLLTSIALFFQSCASMLIVKIMDTIGIFNGRWTCLNVFVFLNGF